MTTKNNRLQRQANDGEHVERVLVKLRETAEAARVALDAWLEAPRLSRNNIGIGMRPIEEFGPPERWHDQWRSEPPNLEDHSYRQREHGIRALIMLLERGAERRWPRGGWYYAGKEPTIAHFSASAFLRVLYTDFRGDIIDIETRDSTTSANKWGNWHHRPIRAAFGYEDSVPNGTNIMTPAWVGVRYLASTISAREQLDLCIADIMRCLRETWDAVAGALAACGPQSDLHKEFLFWMVERNRPVQHTEVLSWIAVGRGHPANRKWGANDPAGPLLRRFCEKQGPPGSRAPWALRAEARNWVAAHSTRGFNLANVDLDNVGIFQIVCTCGPASGHHGRDLRCPRHESAAP